MICEFLSIHFFLTSARFLNFRLIFVVFWGQYFHRIPICWFPSFVAVHLNFWKRFASVCAVIGRNVNKQFSDFLSLFLLQLRRYDVVNPFRSNYVDVTSLFSKGFSWFFFQLFFSFMLFRRNFCCFQWETPKLFVLLLFLWQALLVETG